MHVVNPLRVGPLSGGAANPLSEREEYRPLPSPRITGRVSSPQGLLIPFPSHSRYPRLLDDRLGNDTLPGGAPLLQEYAPLSFSFDFYRG
jgi:hypothetical protein